MTVDRTYRDGTRFYINGPFNDEMEIGVVAPLRSVIEDQAGRVGGLIELYINSNGGSVNVMVQLVELVELAKRRGVKVRTIVLSHAYSCGSMLAITGTKGERYISRYAEHLAHYGQFDGYRKETPLQVERHADRFRRHTDMLLDHYDRYAAIPDLAEHLKDDGFWIPAEQAIVWGLADKYTDELGGK